MNEYEKLKEDSKELLKKMVVNNMRKTMSTLPEQKPKKNYDIVSIFHPDACTVKLVEYPKNPYKYIVRMSISTWGNGKLGFGNGSTGKWERLTPEARYIVALSVLTGNTLPVSQEAINMLWEFNGVPRHTFDQFVRMRIGTGHASIGCRDNCKLDVPLVLYPKLSELLAEDMDIYKDFIEWNKRTKDLYEKILTKGKSSWQMARAVLPMSYSHSWLSYISLLTLKGQAARRLMPCEEAPMVLIFWRMWNEVFNKWPLIANYIRPACDKVNKCIYAGGAEGLTKYFSSLFAGCGRWETDSNYSEFNFSCTDITQLKRHVNYIEPNQWINYNENSYDILTDKDKNLFEED